MIFQTAEQSRVAGITYHIVPVEVWQRQADSESYLPEAFDADGFIHTTNGLDVMTEVANRYYTADPRPFTLLVLDVSAIGSPVRYDDDEQIYPHIYGPLNTSAVVGQIDVRRADDGSFLGFGDEVHPVNVR